MFVVSIPLFTGYDSASGTMQFLEKVQWIGAINANYHLGADGISIALILLTTFTTVLVILGAWDSVHDKVNQYLAAFLVLEGLMIGVFAAMDALLFYVFFEGMLIPMFIIIGIWGGPRRVYATLKFFLYTFFGSIFMLIGLIYLYLHAHSWELADLAKLPLSATEQAWLFFAFLFGFAIKVPMWPVHTWLPDAHVEAPTGGSVILAAIMLKIGGYGFIRFSLAIVPDACQEFAWLIIALSLIAVIYIGFVALVQDDMKKLIAYSSISHMGFVTLGTVHQPGAGARERQQGRGISGRLRRDGADDFARLRFRRDVPVRRRAVRPHAQPHDRDYGGVVNTMPRFAAFWMLFAMANCGLPGTSGFVGEFMVILASFAMSPWVAAGAALILIIGAAYTLWLVKRVIFGAIANDHVAKLKDINPREALVLGAFAAGVLVVGVWPAPLTHLMDASIRLAVDHLLAAKS